MDTSKEHPLIVVVGPTGSGKSDLALRLAEELRGEVVNCDSVQVYRGFDAGTAKLALQERRGIAHHLIDIAQPDQLFSAGEYARVGREVLREIAGSGRVPVVAGGTGFYLRSLLEGLSQGPARDEVLRERLLERERRRGGSLHQLLHRLDPEASMRIHPNDLNKTLRALELRLLRKAPAATLERPDTLRGFRAVKVGLDPERNLLYERLNQRLSEMFERGLVEEVEALLAKGVPAGAKPFESLGYQQALLLIQKRMTREEAIAAAQMETRRYAKRQMTWFRRERDVQWFRGFGDAPAVQVEVLAFLRDHLQALHNTQTS